MGSGEATHPDQGTAHAALIEHAAEDGLTKANGSGQSAEERRKALPKTRDDLKRYEDS